MLLYISQKVYIHDTSQLKITLQDYSPVKDGETFWQKFGFKHVTGDGEAFLINPSKFNMKSLKTKIERNLFEKPNSGGGSQYIMTKKGKRKIHIGKRGGKYYIMNKKKIYIK